MTRSIAVAAIICAALTLIGCGRQQAEVVTPPVAAGGTVGDAGGPVQVRFTYSEKTCYLPVVVAVERGIYEQEGVAIDRLVVTGGIESAEAIISGQADLAALGDAPAVICMSRSPRIKLLCATATGERMHRLVVRNDAGIAGPRDLVGKRIAVQHGSSTHGGLLLYLQAHNVDPAEVTLVSLSPRDFPEAMASGQIDGIAGSQPWPHNVMQACDNCSVLANFEGLGASYPLVVLAREEFVQEHPEAARAIMRGTQTAVEFIDASPEQAAELLSRRSGVPAERELEMMQDYDFRVGLDEAIIGDLVETARFLAEQGRIDEVPDIETRVAFPEMVGEGGDAA